MAEEKLFTINLRKEFMKVANYKKSKKSVKAVKEFICQHMKIPLENIKIGKNLNSKIWERGRKHPPSKIKIKSLIQEGIAYVELPEFKFEEIKVADKKEKPAKIEEIVKESPKVEEKKKEDIKALEKEEIAEQKKEHKPELKEVPSKELKQNEKIKEKTQKYSKVIPESGKKGAKEAKH